MKDSVFTSKSNVLKLLQEKVKKSKIEKIYDFTVLEWNIDNTIILDTISKYFGSQKVIVRSSAVGEDSDERSEAGNYESILNVPADSSTKLRNSINSVIKSYIEKGNTNPTNQILIQKQAKNIVISGVVFTRTADIGAPYYVINFEEGSSTDSVTKGYVNNSVKIFRKVSSNKLEKKWKTLLESIKEIELILDIDLLDIEFGITKTDQVIIFQVRPITSLKNIMEKNLDSKIKNIISKNKNKFTSFMKPRSMLGSHTIFSDMADWNPAEIIGNNPNLLDYSLYDYLIMKKAWSAGRTIIGYQSVRSHGLMTKFGNKPYVDTVVSFNSLIPNKINQRLKQKLIEYYLDKLEKHPHLHDKVEFEILFTCYDPSLNSRLKELVGYKFSTREINHIKSALLDFTNEIIKRFPQISRGCTESMEIMHENRINIISKLTNSKRTHNDLLYAAEKLLKNCIEFGTIPFSTVARIAFIGSALLRGMVKEGHLSAEFYNEFMNSITTPVSEIQADFVRYMNNEITKKEFLKKYGHLRPGTYDITSLRYDAENPFLDNIKFLKPSNPEFKNKKYHMISKILEQHGLKFSEIDFFTFVKNSLIQREKLKFEFTHNLSDAIELIAETGKKLGFSRNEMSNLDINTILKTHKKQSKTKLIEIWRNKMQNEIKRKTENGYLVLPPIIYSETDFDIIKYHIAKPNYITNKVITSDITSIKDSNKYAIENKIVLIENADPGYDWIFTKSPAGLITKYGGIASHMAIRCAEIGLPAAIGCGEILYEKLRGSSKVILDCTNEQIVILEYEKHDESVEVKKALKSLGYIK